MPPSLPLISSASCGSVAEDVKNDYAKFANSSERRKGLTDRFVDDFGQPMRNHAAEHQVYMETTVADFTKKMEHLDRLLRSETARRTQIGMTFRAFFKDTMLEVQQYGLAQRAATAARVSARFEDAKRRLDELCHRLPIEQSAMLERITQKTEAIRTKVDFFLAVECANESADCKARHQVLMDQVGTSAVLVEDQMQSAQKQRQTSMGELRDLLEQSSTLAAKNAHKLTASLQHHLADLKNSLTTETLMRELSDTELAVAMQRQVSFVMQSAKAVNSTLGLDEVEPLDYATRQTLADRQKRVERALREHLRRERDALLAGQADGGGELGGTTAVALGAGGEEDEASVEAEGTPRSARADEPGEPGVAAPGE